MTTVSARGRERRRIGRRTLSNPSRVLSQFERPHPKPDPDKGLGGWVRGMWRRWTS